jgi:hypothetical protein
MDTPTPAEARDALDRARQARRSTAESFRPPWWLWAALGVVLALYTAANDFGSTAQSAASIVLGVLAVAWVAAERLSPRVAAISGTAHRSAMPRYFWVPILGVGVVFVIAEYVAAPAVHHLLVGSGMPAWIRAHPYTTEALPYAVLYVAVGLLLGAVVRQMARHAATR